jgi:hypothetical protein
LLRGLLGLGRLLRPTVAGIGKDGYQKAGKKSANMQREESSTACSVSQSTLLLWDKAWTSAVPFGTSSSGSSAVSSEQAETTS